MHVQVKGAEVSHLARNKLSGEYRARIRLPAVTQAASLSEVTQPHLFTEKIMDVSPQFGWRCGVRGLSLFSKKG